MTILEPRAFEAGLELPAGIELFDDVRQGFDRIILGVGNILLGKINPAIVNEYNPSSVEAQTIASVICELNEKKPSTHQITFSPIPGAAEDDLTVGIWVMPAETVRNRDRDLS